MIPINKSDTPKQSVIEINVTYLNLNDCPSTILLNNISEYEHKMDDSYGNIQHYVDCNRTMCCGNIGGYSCSRKYCYKRID